ncbi:MAG: hypothetical protein V3W11_01195 [bacterium]
MAKSFLEGLKGFLGKMKEQGELPDKYVRRLAQEITELEPQEENHFDAEREVYDAEWGLELSNLQAEMLFYRFIFNDRNRKLARVFKIISKGVYEPREEEFEDEIKELVIYSYVSASREYGLLDEIFHDPELRRQKPLFRREIYDKFFIEYLYDNLKEIAVDVLEFRKIGLNAGEKERLSAAVDQFKREHPKEEYLTSVLPLSHA